MAIDIGHFKKKLEIEEKLLEEELGKVGRRNPDNLSDWEAVPTDKDISQADENTVADNVENYEDNIAIVDTLETRYQDVKSALEKINQGTYGLCQVCHKEIDTERLEANSSARNCREHME
jgi:RNA polymerase-binding transcription factor DksA